MSATSVQRVVNCSVSSYQVKWCWNKDARTRLNIHPFGIIQGASIAQYFVYYARFFRSGKNRVESGSEFLRLRNLGILLQVLVSCMLISFQENEQTLGKTAINPLCK